VWLFIAWLNPIELFISNMGIGFEEVILPHLYPQDNYQNVRMTHMFSK
jgi:hypothetical protein